MDSRNAARQRAAKKAQRAVDRDAVLAQVFRCTATGPVAEVWAAAAERRAAEIRKATVKPREYEGGTSGDLRR